MALSKKPERDCDSMEVRLYNRGWNAAIDAITAPPAQRKPLTDEQIEADMFWDYDDAEQPHDSIETFLNNEICNGYLEVGAVFTLLRAKRLSNMKIRVTSIDENESEAEYEIIEATLGIKENT